MELEGYKELKEITDYLQNPEQVFKEEKAANIALHSGLSGVIITLVNIRKKFPELVDPDIIRQYIAKTYDILSESEAFYPSFCGGLAGYAYLLHLLKEEQILEGDYSEVLAEIDEILDEHFEINLEEEDIDILHGAMGLGLYFIETGKKQQVEALVDRLAGIAQREGDQCYWKTFDHYKTRKYKIDFGLAHGNAGVQYFLGKCIYHNIKTDACKGLLQASLNFYKNNTQDHNVIQSYFPVHIPEENYLDKTYAPETSRMAWCYGDLGILYTQLFAADIMEMPDLKLEIIGQLKQTAQRRTKENTMHNDAGFCHGTSGLSIMFQNIYQLTKEPEFLETAQYWLQQTHAYKNSTATYDVVAYRLFEGSRKNEIDVTLLEGISGVAAAYLANLTTGGTTLLDKKLFLRY